MASRQEFKQINKILKKGRLTGRNRECKYYPCHDLTGIGSAFARDSSSYDSEMDCTFCFCPFYPCNDGVTGGETIITKSGELVWGCKNCGWIHKPVIARKVMDEILKLKINDINKIDHEKLLEIRAKCLK